MLFCLAWRVTLDYVELRLWMPTAALLAKAKPLQAVGTYYAVRDMRTKHHGFGHNMCSS